MTLWLGAGTPITILYALGLGLLVTCGGATTDPVVGAGGAAGTGGIVATGGAAGTGGIVATGGAAGTGGIVATGGTAGTGGVTVIGGSAGTAGLGPAGGAAGAAGSDSSCAADADCAWGEIDHEITTRADCICLFGCPGLIQNKTTVARRQAHYAALCDPSTDGQGRPCPIDDCMMPPALACVKGQCAVASAADGGTRSCGKTGDPACPSGQFCELAGLCGENQAGGTCLVKPTACDLMYAPVCGCNELTYGNNCARQNAGQSKAADGACN
jgi:hypothetical protein